MTENLTTVADQTAATDTAADIAARFGIEDFAGIAQQLEKKDPQERTRWALETFTDRIVLTSSFGAQSAVMLHLATRERPDIPVIFVDTGYLFAETYHFIDELTDSLDLNLQVFRSEHSAAWLEARHGKLWENGVKGNRALQPDSQGRADGEGLRRNWMLLPLSAVSAASKAAAEPNCQSWRFRKAASKFIR